MAAWEHRILTAGVDYGYHTGAERDKVQGQSQTASVGFLSHAPVRPSGGSSAELARLPLLEELLRSLGEEGWQVSGLSQLAVILSRPGS